jgi:hypothetical protein
MKTARILNRKSLDQLFFHILDGFKSSHEGAQFILKEGVITETEYKEILEMNSARLIERVREFRIVNNLLSIFFACLFGYMQVSGEELDMRRTARARTTRGTRSAKGRRRNDIEDSSMPPITIESV